MGNLHQEDPDRSRVLGDLSINHIIPVATKYQTMLLDNVYKLRGVFSEKEAEELNKDDMP